MYVLLSNAEKTPHEIHEREFFLERQLKMLTFLWFFSNFVLDKSNRIFNEVNVNKAYLVFTYWDWVTTCQKCGKVCQALGNKKLKASAA